MQIMKSKIFLTIGAALMSVATYAVQEGLQSITNNAATTGQVLYEAVVAGSQYKLTPQPASGYEFIKWSDGNTDNPRTIIIADDATFYAIFAKENFTSSVDGTVEVTLTNAKTGVFSLEFESCGYNTFARWSNKENASQNPIDYQESDGYVYPKVNALYHQVDINEFGTVTYKEIECGYELTAVPNGDNHFLYWDDNKSYNPVREVEHIEKKYVAKFAAGFVAGESGVYQTISEALTAGETEITILANMTEDLVIANEKDITVNGNGMTLNGDIIINNGGKLTLAGDITCDAIFLSGTAGTSSQLVGENKLHFTNAYYDFTMEPNKTEASTKLWYAFSVPFNVNILSGIRHASDPTTELANMTNYILTEYDGQMRATNDDGNGWKKMQTGSLNPGKFYMIGVNDTENTWRFISSDAALTGTESLTMPAYDGSVKNGGWNAMANSMLTYASATTKNGVLAAQVYENGAAVANYKVRSFSGSSFSMACPFFVQVGSADQLNFSSDTHGTLYAPNRSNETEAYYRLQLLENGNEADVIYLLANEDASNMYEMGKDVIKLSANANYPHLYTRAYGLNLCVENAPINNEVATYDLTIASPKAASYTLALKETSEEVTLWKGKLQVWNFSDGDYQVNVPQGFTSDYQLQIRKIPTVSTSLKAIESPSSVRKYIRDGQLYIRVNDRHFNVQGAALNK